MKLSKVIGFLSLCILLLTACGGNSKDGSGFSLFSKSELKKHYPDFDEKVLADTLRSFFSGTTRIDKFYQNNQHEPLWTKDIFESPSLDSLLSYINIASTHGLNPELFSNNKIKQLVDTIRTGSFSNNMPVLYKNLAELEYLASKAFFDYNTVLRFGVINPKEEFSKEYFIDYQRPDSNHFANLSAALKSNPTEFLKSSQPTDTAYIKLQEALKFYQSKESSVFEAIPKKDKKNYKLNDADPTVFPAIAKRLMLTGELPQTTAADSIYRTLTPDLFEAINKFRKQASYPEDDEVGGLTIDALNRPMSYYAEKIKVNLERLRWKRVKPLGAKFVEVNVAAFMLKAIEPGYDPLLMRVCVGKAGTNQTPLLESDIYYINLNPNWSVPRSIIDKEISVHMKRNPNYLQRNRMKLIDKNGKEVDPSTVDWSTRVPYSIRQDPGAGNSLGRIKFMFNNPFSVYLHDTPSKYAFAYKNRAVSHGCVRVQKPIELSYFLLEKKDPVYLDRILISIDKAPESQEGKDLQKKGQLRKLENVINLAQKVPLTIDYFTVYVLPDGNVYFADDVYNMDGKILKKLQTN